MNKKRVPVESPALEDGFYWFQNFINLDGGGHVDEWKLARINRGRVQRFGSEAVIDLGCPYLRHARWVKIEPPDTEAAPVTAIRHGVKGRSGRGLGRTGGSSSPERVRLVAEEIVSAFVAMHDSTAGYYARHPVHKEELIAQIARLIERVRE